MIDESTFMEDFPTIGTFDVSLPNEFLCFLRLRVDHQSHTTRTTTTGSSSSTTATVVTNTAGVRLVVLRPSIGRNRTIAIVLLIVVLIVVVV